MRVSGVQPLARSRGALAVPFRCLTLLCLLSGARSVGHIHRRVTEHLKVVYYVAENFAEEYTGTNLKNVERSVEDDYIANLRNNCWKEKQQSEWRGLGGRKTQPSGEPRARWDLAC